MPGGGAGVTPGGGYADGPGGGGPGGGGAWPYGLVAGGGGALAGEPGGGGGISPEGVVVPSSGVGSSPEGCEGLVFGSSTLNTVVEAPGVLADPIDGANHSRIRGDQSMVAAAATMKESDPVIR